MTRLPSKYIPNGYIWGDAMLSISDPRQRRGLAEYLKHYHKRSNVESTFSMIKAKFRDHVRSKTDVAMKNEVLCKIICHNIFCLIQESHELGIDTSFWSEPHASIQ
jgi:transposase